MIRIYLCFVAAAFGLLCVPSTGAAQAPKADAKYVVRETIDLTPALHGTTGRLELLTDARIKPDMSDADTFDFPHAKIRVVGADGSVSQEKTLERSRATLDTAPPLYGQRRNLPTYLLTVDYSAGMGSYNGPITFLVEVVNGAMRFAPVQGKPISLMRSLKTDWKFSPQKGRSGQTTDILEVSCRPRANIGGNADPNKDFVTTYRRFHWNGRSWTKREKTRLGFWEDDGHFPPLTRFPAYLP